MKAKILQLAAGLCLSFNAIAEIELAEDHPSSYTVVEGDTLWDISGKFLETPWQWPEVWAVNEQIENPHLIYPGDIIHLRYCNGKPCLQVERSVKLSPVIRTDNRQAIAAIPLDAIRPFLNNPRIFESAEEFFTSPYVVQGARENLIVGEGQEVFVRGEEGWASPGANYGIYREGSEWYDPVTEELLGYEAVDIGDANVVNSGEDIARLFVTRSRIEIRPADRVVENDSSPITPMFYPAAPDAEIEGVILDVEGGVTQVGASSVVMINKGDREALEPGNVLTIWKNGEWIVDPVTGDDIQMPSQRAGVLMVFQTFEKMSYAIVLEADRPLKVGDVVKTP